jgi:hypothetical protein
MRPGAGAWVVRGVFLLLAVVAWQTGVLVPALCYFAGLLSGVASVYVVKRFQVGGN